MDVLNLVQFIQKVIRDRRSQILDNLESGNLQNMEQYKYLMGEKTALDYVAQELSDLLEKQEQIDD